METKEKRKSLNPMGRPKGAKNKMTKTIKEAIEKAFHGQVKKGWLDKIAEEEPAVFAGLVKAIIPAEINANLQHNHTLQVNIGEAMAIANQKLAQLENKGAIDMTLDNGSSYQVIEKQEEIEPIDQAKATVIDQVILPTKKRNTKT